MSTVPSASHNSAFATISSTSFGQHESTSQSTVARRSASQDDFPAPSPGSYHYPPLTRSSERPYTSHGTPNRPSTATTSGPYTSASARTSYTRVDVDSVPSAAYPGLPLPSIPTSVSVDLNINGTLEVVNPVPSGNTEPSIPKTPRVFLTFLLVSGRRKSQSFDPETTVGRVKELVWNTWPARDAEWQDERPPAPSYFRMLYLGKILQDDDTLIRLGFPTSLPSSSTTTPTIVHLSIRPYVPPYEDPSLSKRKRLSVAFNRRGNADTGVDEAMEDGGERPGCCRSCIVC